VADTEVIWVTGFVLTKTAGMLELLFFLQADIIIMPARKNRAGNVLLRITLFFKTSVSILISSAPQYPGF
jgi:hypothetical protein